MVGEQLRPLTLPLGRVEGDVSSDEGAADVSGLALAGIVVGNRVVLSRASATTNCGRRGRCRSEAPPDCPQAAEQQAEAEADGDRRAVDRRTAHPRFPECLHDQDWTKRSPQRPSAPSIDNGYLKHHASTL